MQKKFCGLLITVSKASSETLYTRPSYVITRPFPTTGKLNPRTSGSRLIDIYKYIPNNNK